MEAEPPRLVVDLSDVGFVDSAGIGLLVTAHRRAEQSGGRLVLTGVNDVVAHVLALTRTDRLLSISPSMEQAVTATTAE
jgi:anti-sigma B factor antagonist